MSDQHYVDNVLANLKVISMVKEGARLRLIGGQLCTDFPSPLQPIRRWLKGDNRSIMVSHVRGVIHNAINIIKIESIVASQDEDRIWIINKILEALESCQDGIRNLMNTYDHDAVVLCSLEVLLDKVSNCLNSQAT